jgi:fermentation-respiration switch protein FrsA (DUF1100 family)
MEITPDEISLVYEDVWLKVANKKGETEGIHGWWLPNSTPNSPVLLYLHGNGKNISGNLGRAEFYHQQGFSVFLIDYRGYGKSQGQFPNETRVYQDAQLAYDYLVKEKGIKPESIFLYGHSLGGAIAINLAVNQPEISGIIVESTFTSIGDVAKINQLYRLFPLDLILTQKFDSIKKINRLKSPILIIHGTRDQLIPASMSEMLYNSAKVPKKLLLVEGADHYNVRTVSEEKYLQTINNFVNYVQQTLQAKN